MSNPAQEIAARTALERILAEAEKLFAEFGFEGVSMSQVATAAGVSKANVFHHFANKRDLYERVLATACETFSVALDELDLGEGGLAVRLQRLIEWHEAFLHQRPLGTRLVLREITETEEWIESSPVFPLVRRNFERVVSRLAECRDELREGITPVMVARVVLSLNLFGFQVQHLDRQLVAVGALAPPPELQRQWLELLLHGIQRRD